MRKTIKVIMAQMATINRGFTDQIKALQTSLKKMLLYIFWEQFLSKTNFKNSDKKQKLSLA